MAKGRVNNFNFGVNPTVSGVNQPGKTRPSLAANYIQMTCDGTRTMGGQSSIALVQV